jgi:hypothetical protein
MSTEIIVNNDIIEINVTEEPIIIEAPSGAYPLPTGVYSVYGRTGNVVAQEGDYTLTLLGDVAIVTPSTGQVLRYNGTAWVNNTESYVGTVTSVAATVPTGLTIAGSPITTSGTLAFGLDTGYVIPLQATLDAKALKATTISTTAPLTGGGDLSANRTFAIAKSTISVDGYLAATDFTIFNNKQAALSGSGIVKSTAGVISYLTDNTANWDTAYTNRITSLTTTGSSGAATLSGNVLNIPNYGSALSSYVPYSGATTNVNLGANNIYANAFFGGFLSITASASQVVLTVLSAPEILVNGSGGQTIKLPDATTLPNGVTYSFNNNQSSGAIIVNNNSNTLIVSIPSGGYAEVVLLDNSIAAGSWDRHFQAPSNVSWSTNTFDYAGSITSATWNGSTVAINRGGTGATTASAALSNLGGIGLTSLSATTPLAYNNTTGAFSIQVASGSQNGYLSSTDWTTFNSKQSALTNPITGTGTTNTLPKFTGTSAIGNSNITDTGSLITLGSNSYVNGSLGIGTSSLTGYNLRIAKNITGLTSSLGISQDGTIQSDVTNAVRLNHTNISTEAASFNLTTLQHYVASALALGAGSSVTSQFGFSVLSNVIGATNNYGFYGALAAATNTWNLYMLGTANNYLAGSLGIGATGLTGYSLRVSKDITGATTAYAIRQDGSVQSDVTSAASNFASFTNTTAASFTLGAYTHFSAQQGTIGAGSSITTQYGFLVTSNMIGATNNYGFYGNIPSGTNRWNLYMNGTADNYLAGGLSIGSTSFPGTNLRVSKNVTGGFLFTATAGAAMHLAGTVQSDVTAQASYAITRPQTAATAFTVADLVSYCASNATIGAGSTVTRLVGFSVESAHIGGTNNWAFSGGLAAASNTWNLYMGGNAANYLAGKLLIGSTTDVPSASVAITSTTQGFLPPRMTTTQKLAIGTPAAGLMVYDTTLNQMSYYNGTTWINF